MTRSTALPFAFALALAGCSRGGYQDPGPDADLAPAVDLGPPQQDQRGPAPDLLRVPSAEVSFGPATTFPAGQFAYHFAVGRIDKDDVPDLVVSGRPEATVYLAQGDGSFLNRPTSTLANWQVAIADVNRDDLGDLLLTDTGRKAIAVSLSNGDGSFRAMPVVATGGTPQGVGAGDLNGDGAPDLLAVDQAGNKLLSFLGKGDGTFTPSGSAATGKAPLWVETGDLNRDGRFDAVVSNLNSASFSVFIGQGNGTFGEGREVTTLSSPVVLKLGDLDGDGVLDLALNGEGAIHAVAVHLGDGLGGFGPARQLMLSAGSGQGLAIADLNTDGILDIVATCAFTSPARVFLGLGDGGFLPEKTFPGATNNVFNVAAADWNRDGLPDLALSEGSDRKISVLLNTTRPR